MSRLTRRAFGGTALAAGLIAPLARAAAAARLPRTPAQTEGPFYPVRKPARPDNDLVRVAGRRDIAHGELLRLDGRVVDSRHLPVPGVTVEIWQVDHQGYSHPRAPGHERFDPAFQGDGESLTDAEGRYRFLTIVPAIYPGRTPHIHVKLRRDGAGLLTTQLYLVGDRANGRDSILRRLLGPGSGTDLLIDPVPDGELRGRPVVRAGFRFVV